MTAGTIFDLTRTPLTVWFTACWLFATQRDGDSAQSLQRALEIGSYQTAWAMLRRLRSVLVRPGCADVEHSPALTVDPLRPQVKAGVVLSIRNQLLGNHQGHGLELPDLH